jgi:Outer membrane protein beta-barrel domain
MKQIPLLFFLLLLAMNSFAQKGFGVDGSIGIGRNEGDLVYPLLLEGRMQFNDYLSVNLGLGLWNSGLKDSWNEDEPEANFSTLYRLSSNKTLPSLQLGTRGQVPVFTLKDREIRLFVEPKLYFLPFSAQTVTLREVYYDMNTNSLTNEITYTEQKGTSKSESMKSESHPRLYGGVQVGFAFELMENIDLAISYGYTNMDLFKDLRGTSIQDQSLKGRPLNPHLPRTDLQQLSVSFLVNFNLN